MCSREDKGDKRVGNGIICSTTQAISATGAARGSLMVVRAARKLAERRKTPSPRMIISVTRKKGGEVPPNASTAIHIATLRPASAIRSTGLLTADPRLTSVVVEYPESPPPGNFPPILCRQESNPHGSRNSHWCVDLLCSRPRR